MTASFGVAGCAGRAVPEFTAMVRKADVWLLDGFPLPRPWWKFW